MIVTRPAENYLHTMVARRLVRILTMLALLLAPLSMVSEHAAMAMPAPTASAHHEQAAGQSAHCAEMAGQTQTEDQDSRSGDCLIDCAIACSAIPPLANIVADHTLPPALAQPLPLVSRIAGLHPESDDPPPRTA
ncbi:MAG TPA: hypothetical protein VF631_14000 [Allosphingosinicella sp.]|jgi:putative hemolysin|uniref:hypothetical protein n=1 Tax=Allosphingosinicella sp. TaxID=2823234 RepID=UPI002F28BBEA